MLTRSIVLLIAAAATMAGAQAQNAPKALTAPDWSIDASKLDAARRKAPARKAPAVSAAEAERAARLAEGRRKFFEKPEEHKPDTIPDFGGYDASKAGDGSLRPGATLKF